MLPLPDVGGPGVRRRRMWSAKAVQRSSECAVEEVCIVQRQVCPLAPECETPTVYGAGPQPYSACVVGWESATKALFKILPGEEQAEPPDTWQRSS